MAQETYQQKLERIYSEDSTRVGVKEDTLDSIANGFYEDVKYDDKPQFWQNEGITREEFEQAQAKWNLTKYGERVHPARHQGKP